MYWRLNNMYNIVIFLLFLYLARVWHQIGLQLACRCWPDFQLQHWLWAGGQMAWEEKRNKMNFPTWQMKIYEGFGVDWGVPNWLNDLSGIPFWTIFGEPSKMAMHSPNFRPWGDLGHPSVELGLIFLRFIQGSMSYVFYGSLAVLIWKCGFQLLKEAK